ncbi:MAG: TIGR04066 family peptide maturation system protein [Defluviitaleaceae bacterium]|nr:TIGR04066 family peptide maturation system protein [Defluviitaleaceae bacterium]MCL2275118.1 TIGR04066 family peptide maturation system protein [Defluviitaleaceae bacterium]
MSKKLVLFPASHNMCAVARHVHLLRGYQLHSIMESSSLMLNKKDISEVDGGNPAGIMIDDVSNEIIKSCDVLYIDYNESYRKREIYERVMNVAKVHGKELIISKREKCSLGDELIKKSINTNKVRPIINDINVPVIFILSQGERTDQLAVELTLYSHFMEQGYKITHIGSTDVGCLFGFDCTPAFLHEDRCAEEKIIMFNNYVRTSIERDASDVVIISVSDAIMKYNNRILNGLGVMPFVMTNAVRSDVSLYCMHFAENLNEYIKEIKMYCHYRFDCKPSYFCVANTAVRYEANTNADKLNYTALDSQFVLDSLKREEEASGMHLFNALDKKSIANVCTAIELELQNNAVYVK